MNNNWDPLIRAIVPLSFMAIWAITSLFNRESKNKPPARTDAFRPPSGTPSVRSGDPTLRWNTPNTVGPSTIKPAVKRPPVRIGADDEIVILSSESNRRDRSSSSFAAKRPTKGKPVVPQRRPEPSTTTTRLAGVSQNVNQHLTNSSLEMTPLAAMPTAYAAQSLGLSSTPSVAPTSFEATPLSYAALALADPVRLREAFILNEILLPPVSMRDRRIGPATK